MSEKYLLMKSVWPELWRTYCWTTTITYKNSTKYALPKRRKKLLYSSYFRSFSPKTYVVQFGVQLKNVDSIVIILWNRNSAIFTDIFTCSCPFVPKRCNTNEIARFCWSLGMPGANMKHSLASYHLCSTEAGFSMAQNGLNGGSFTRTGITGFVISVEVIW